MSSNYAGIHLYCEDSNVMVEKLKAELGNKAISKSEERALDVVNAVFNKKITDAKDTDEKAKAEDICQVIGVPHLLKSLQKVLSSQEGDKMAEVFEEEIGLRIYMDEDMCRDEGMKEVFHSEALTIFRL